MNTTIVYATRNGDDDKIIIGVSQFGPQKYREANARLITASPDLFAAAKDALVPRVFGTVPMTAIPTSAYEALRAAVAKATGAA